jgi:hypothetical protein
MIAEARFSLRAGKIQFHAPKSPFRKSKSSVDQCLGDEHGNQPAAEFQGAGSGLAAEFGSTHFVY